MIFISLGKFKEKPTKEMTAEIDSQMEKMSKEGIKLIGIYSTLGRFDAVAIFEAQDEKAAMKVGLMGADFLKTETLVAIPRKEALKLLD